eukprot:12885410-Prorocentrum_lima.AAC.1
MAGGMVPDLDSSGLSMPPCPQMCTPPRMSTPGASSKVPGYLAFSPGRTTPRYSPGGDTMIGIQ